MFSKDFLNGDLEISEYYGLQTKVWEKKNQEFWGLTAQSQNNLDSPFLIRQMIIHDQDNFWNNGTCILKEHLLDNSKFHGRELMVKNSWKLDYNPINRGVGLSALFLLSSNNKNLNSTKAQKAITEINALNKRERNTVIKNRTYKDYKLTVCRIAVLPLVTQLGYMLKNSQLSLRIQAIRNEYLMKKINGKIRYKNWIYDGEQFISHKTKKKIDVPIKTINPAQLPLLSAAVGGAKITKSNLQKALDNLPEYDKDSILYFNFRWFEEVSNTVLHSKSTINVKNGKIVSYAQEINAPKRRYGRRNDKLRDLCTNLVMAKSKMKALEITRTAIYAPKGDYSPAFSYKDSENIFDAFKVTTNSLAGRARVLLDHFYIEDDIIKMTYKGKTYTQYDVIFGNAPKEIYDESAPSLSCLSRVRYNYLNDAKRIMFCSKLRGQAVQVKAQVDDLTHEVPARVVFADWEGFSFGDSFVISESFAKKLERHDKKRFEVPKEKLLEINVGDKLTIDDLVEIDGKNRFSSYRDIVVTEVTNTDFEVTARVPFGVGDKITNMHGSKGIVSIILPDDQMPQLQNKLSDAMPAGSIDIIVPGISIYRRKSMGQLFESITRGLGINEIPLEQLYSKYKTKIKNYDNKSIIRFDGREFKAPCGINHFIRLDHDACGKQSFSYIKTNYHYNLNMAEMELLNLASRGYYKILNELDQRSLSKHKNWFHKIKRLQQDGFIKEERLNLSQLQDYFRALGWDIHIDDVLTKEEVTTEWQELAELVSNQEIDVF